MTFRHESTLASYARAAVDLRTRMIDYTRTPLATRYINAFLDTHTNDGPAPDATNVDVFTRIAAPIASGAGDLAPAADDMHGRWSHDSAVICRRQLESPSTASPHARCQAHRP
ncbi:hypothetical protein AB0J14_35295 [Micromonospora arborensis]|uniref:hypothetical protein n=1 Tax=Micromonospora TaxID=1873 RepID=UPI0033D125A6